MGMFPQLRINEINKLLSDLVLAGQCNLLQVFLELFGFKYTIIIQQIALYVLRPPLYPV